jgi:hypothetical protein
MRGESAIEAAHTKLEEALNDSSFEVRITTAQALGQFGSANDLQRVLPQLVEQADWKKNQVFSALAALSSLDALGEKADRSPRKSKRCRVKVPHPTRATRNTSHDCSKRWMNAFRDAESAHYSELAMVERRFHPHPLPPNHSPIRLRGRRRG